MMDSFYTNVIRRDPRYGSTAVIKDLALLEPGTRAAVQAMITEAASLGHELRVGETYRSQQRQHMLYEQKLTQLSNVGVHGFGLAADLQLFVKGKYDPDGQHYEFFQALAQKHKLISGIGWGTPKAHHTFTDWDHLQRVPVFRQNALFAGTWYPDADFDPYADMISHSIPGTS